MVKSLVLCSIPYEDIAAYLGLKVDTIKAYEYLAFAVRDRLQERGYIQNHVLNHALTDVMHSTDYEQLCLREAFLHGIEGIMPYMGLGVGTEEEIERIQVDIRQELAIKAKTALRVLPVNSHTALELLTQNATYSKNRAESDHRERLLRGVNGVSGVTPQDLQQRIVGLMGGIGLSVAPTAVESDNKNLPAREERVTKTFEAEVLQVLQEEAQKAQGA